MVVGVAAAVVLLAVLLAIGTAFLGSGRAKTDGADRAARDGGPASSLPSAPARSVIPRPAALPTLSLQPPLDGRFPSFEPGVGGLRDGSVVLLELSGFTPDTTGTVEQCVYRDGGLTSCGNSFGVRFDATGTARAQYQVSVAPTVSSCSGYVRPCMIAIDDHHGRRAVGASIFGHPLPDPGVVTVTPAIGLRRGERVRVEVSQYPPGAEVYLARCTPSGAWAPLACTRLDTDETMTVGADGSAQSVVEVTGSASWLAVLSEDVWPRAAVVRLTFREPTGPSLATRQTVVALAVSVALLAIAAWLWLRTDWRPPSEAATAELDAARLE